MYVEMQREEARLTLWFHNTSGALVVSHLTLWSHPTVGINDPKIQALRHAHAPL